MTSYVCARKSKARPGTESERRRGGQPGNLNGLKTGEHTRAAKAMRKAGFAKTKALAHLMVMGGLSPHRLRPRPIRTDQWPLLETFAPELALLLAPHLPVGFFAVDSAACPYVLGAGF